VIRLSHKPVETVVQAMDIAKEVAQKAGLGFAAITSVRREQTYWLVDITSLIGNFRIKINATNGEVVEFTPPA